MNQNKKCIICDKIPGWFCDHEIFGFTCQSCITKYFDRLKIVAQEAAKDEVEKIRNEKDNS
jgi:hypothetical protein